MKRDNELKFIEVADGVYTASFDVIKPVSKSRKKHIYNFLGFKLIRNVRISPDEIFGKIVELNKK